MFVAVVIAAVVLSCRCCTLPYPCFLDMDTNNDRKAVVFVFLTALLFFFFSASFVLSVHEKPSRVFARTKSNKQMRIFKISRLIKDTRDKGMKKPFVRVT